MSIENLKCEDCEAKGLHPRITNERGWKQHMSTYHKGWREKGPDVARNLTGFDSAKAVSDSAPETDAAGQPGQPGVAGSGSKTAKPARLSRADAERAEKSDKAREMIGAILCKKAARGPYVALAAVFNDARWLLLQEEEKELYQAYLQLAESTDADFTKPIWSWIAVLAVNSDILAARLPLLFVQAEEEPKPDGDTPPKPN